MYAMGDKGIFQKAKDAKDKTAEAIRNEQEHINQIDNRINEYTNGNANNSNARIEISTILQRADKNILAKDSLENPITIPEGFRVVPDGQDEVEYTYTGDKNPTVQDGIVIEDEEGNQFVWIPVGNIKNKDGSSTEIKLARYTFDITINSNTNEISGGTGAIKQMITDGSSLTDEWLQIYGGEYEYIEEVSSSTTYSNAKAKDIEEFKSMTKLNGGYYLARYEASKGEDNKAKSKSARAWVNITQPAAATAARSMYTSKSFESDLANSYAWDTAVVFIQAYSGDSDYSKQIGPTFSNSLINTGTNGDKRCNVYDMASNANEWITETSTHSNGPCTCRGGAYYYNNKYTGYRYYHEESGVYPAISFRSLLYILK